jgi:hypothetical protein
VEESVHELEGFAIVPETVAVCNIAKFPLQIEGFSVTMHNGSGLFFDIAENPYIVIAREPMYFDSRIGKFAEFPQETGKTLWDDMLVLKPIVYNVAYKEQCLAVGLDRVEETHHPSLIIKRIFQSGGSEVHIGNEVH